MKLFIHAGIEVNMLAKEAPGARLTKAYDVTI